MAIKPTGVIFTDTINLVDCPKCNQKAGYHCQTPSRRKAWPPHNERQRALSIQRPDAVKSAEIKGSNLVNDFKETLEVNISKGKTKKVLTEAQQAAIKAKLLAKVMFED